MRLLTDGELAAADAALNSDRGDGLRQAMFELNLGRPNSVPDGLVFARELGWIDSANMLTELGRLVRDPLREYSLWLERDKVMASGDLVPILQRQNYSGKRVVELGSGAGCNLLTLQGLPGRFVGVEPMPVYLQMMPVLAGVAGLPVPEAVEGSAEAIPFDDASFDIVLCYSSHQYMDIDKALVEMARVLTTHGRIIIIGNSLRPFVPETLGRFWKTRNLGTLKYDVQAIGNTVSYQLRGRRVLKAKDGGTTGMPVYPSSGYMRKQLDQLGFRIDTEHTTQLPSNETALFAVRK